MTKSYFISSALVLSTFVLTIASGCSRAVNSTNSATGSASTVTSVTQAELRTSILKETQPGGKLDFFTPIKGHEYDGAQIKPGIYSTLGHIALYKWGKAVNEMGFKSLEDAYAVISEFRNQAIGQRDKDYIKTGFNKEL